MEDLFNLPPESDDGNIEYKYVLSNLSDDRIQHLCSQMKFRLNEGSGECLYEIGITDNGVPLGIPKETMDESLANLEKLAKMCDAEISSINIQKALGHHLHHPLHQQPSSIEKLVAEARIRYNTGHIPTTLNIVVAGQVDAGKSTWLVTMCKGILDDGRGLARVHIFNHPHEVESGRTSSIGSQILGFDSSGEIVNRKLSKVKEAQWSEIYQNSSRICCFRDLAGHEKYIHTTIRGLTSSYPDYAIIMVGAHMGVTVMTREHIGLCLVQKIPIIILLSKIDMAPEHVYQETLSEIITILKKPGIKKIPQIIKTQEDVFNLMPTIKGGHIVPIIPISCVTGQNLDLMELFFNIVPVRINYTDTYGEKPRYTIDHIYLVPGTGIVLAGLQVKGTIHTRDKMMLGPVNGKFIPVRIKNIKINDAQVNTSYAGQWPTLNIVSDDVKDRHLINQKTLNRGMTLVHPDLTPTGSWEFEANIDVLQAHSTTIKVGYQPVIQMDNIEQAAQLVEIIDVVYAKSHQMGTEPDTYKNIRTGDHALVRFRFCYHPEEFQVGTHIIIREGRTRASGVVTLIRRQQ